MADYKAKGGERTTAPSSDEQIASTNALVLDGPSALALYRDRDDLKAGLQQRDKPSEPVVRFDEDAEDFWLSDEDLAMTLSGESIFSDFSKSKDDAYLESDGETLPPLVRSSMTRMRKAAARSRDLKQVPYETLGIRPPAHSSPLYLLVPQVGRRRSVKHVSQRLCRTTLPERSFLRLGNKVYVPTPELTFLLMAHYLELHQLIVLGMELCGFYRLVGAATQSPLVSNRTLYGRAPLTTPHRIAAFLDRASGVTGLPLAKRALSYLEAGSASPMETALYLLLCLPRKLGGYGLPHPQLNARRQVTPRAGSFTLSKSLVPDLLWPDARLDLEYDSEEFHASEDALQRGARRALALRAMGVEVVSVTKEVVYDKAAFDTLARMVAKAIGARVRKLTESGECERQLLRQTTLFAE